MATPAEKNTKDETEDYRDSVREICAGQHRVTVRCHVDGLRRDSAERFRQQYIPPCEPVRVPLGKPVSLSELAKLISRLAHFSGREIEPLGIIGKGSYSVVYKCFLLRANGVTEAVAVKRPRSRTINSLDNMTFMVEEGVIMQLANHRSIVKVLGFGTEHGENIKDQLTKSFLVEEYLPGGSILDLLEDTSSQRSVPFAMQDALRWMVSTAEALQYLHSLNPMIVHRDIKPDNILLTHPTPSKADAKITDFGLHRAISVKYSLPCSVLNHWKLQEGSQEGAGEPNPLGEMYQMTGGTGSVMYMAPEVMQKVPYNEKVDVFAFGVVMYEVFSGILLRNLYIQDRDRGSDYRRYATRVNSGWRPPLPVEWPQELVSLVSDCWAQSPRDRPSMLDVVQRLEILQASLNGMSSKWTIKLVNLHTSQPSSVSACMQLFNCLCCGRLA